MGSWCEKSCIQGRSHTKEYKLSPKNATEQPVINKHSDIYQVPAMTSRLVLVASFKMWLSKPAILPYPPGTSAYLLPGYSHCISQGYGWLKIFGFALENCCYMGRMASKNETKVSMTVLHTAKLIAKGIGQVCHKEGANAVSYGILKGAFYCHHFALSRFNCQTHPTHWENRTSPFSQNRLENRWTSIAMTRTCPKWFDFAKSLRFLGGTMSERIGKLVPDCAQFPRILKEAITAK